jgi:hypothetical protein
MAVPHTADSDNTVRLTGKTLLMFIIFPTPDFVCMGISLAIQLLRP